MDTNHKCSFRVQSELEKARQDHGPKVSFGNPEKPICEKLRNLENPNASCLYPHLAERDCQIAQEYIGDF